MKLSIHTIEETKFSGDVKSFSVKTVSGEITVLDNHLPIIAHASPGKINYTDLQNKDGELEIGGGILEVRPGSESVILESAG